MFVHSLPSLSASPDNASGERNDTNGSKPVTFAPDRNENLPPVTLLGREYRVVSLNDVRTVITRRSARMWSRASSRVAETVLRGIDVPVTQS